MQEGEIGGHWVFKCVGESEHYLDDQKKGYKMKGGAARHLRVFHSKIQIEFRI